jgi:hypothetical protein
MVRSLSSVVVAVLLAAGARAGVAAEIRGTIYDDPPALALPQHFAGLGGVTVALYKDGGDSLPSADDRLVGSTRSEADGSYRLQAENPGVYWVAVDSRTVRPRGLAAEAAVWAEQTYGPAAARCAQLDGTTRSNLLAGACTGGQRNDASDDARSLATAEHVGRVIVGDSVSGVDFAFSFNVVTTLADSESDAGPRQGSLRQFIHNANALGGAQTMRFVPLAKPVNPDGEQLIGGLPPRWYTMTVRRPLPEIRDGATLDGTAYNFISPATVMDVNQGRIGERPHVRPGDVAVDATRQTKPELEIAVTGDEGIVCGGSCTLKMFALSGPRVGIVTRGTARVENVIVGSRPDVVAIPVFGEVGIQIERGTTSLRAVYVANQRVAGIAAATAEARLIAERLTVTRCGGPASGAAVALISDGSTIRHSELYDNLGAGIIIGTPGQPQRAEANVIESTAISSNLAGVVLSPGASRNRIAGNDIMWNRNGGVVTLVSTNATPVENRITANRFDENGGRPIDLTPGTAANMLRSGVGACETTPNAPNRGVVPPVVLTAKLFSDEGGEKVRVTGKACASHTIEVYLSYVTTDVREEDKEELAMIRRDPTISQRETLSLADVNSPRMAPSIGEFLYLGTVTADADGRFETTYPFFRPAVQSLLTGAEVLRGERSLFLSDPMARAYSALSIDTVGNTSELSSRRKISQ